jgi:hypothetical protein
MKIGNIGRIKMAIIDALHKQKNKPEFPDDCGHPKGSYVGSIQDWQKKWYDIYVYTSETNKYSQDVCIRYGKQGGEYMSPGSLLTVIEMHRQSEVYELALHMILKKGKILFARD